MAARLTPDGTVLATEADLYRYAQQALEGAKVELPRLMAERILEALSPEALVALMKGGRHVESVE